jgi:hypothetical protein
MGGVDYASGLVFHHEQAAAPRFPSKLLFYCERPATSGMRLCVYETFSVARHCGVCSGGGTGITPSWLLHDELAAKYPEFLQRCKDLGVR